MNITIKSFLRSKIFLLMAIVTAILITTFEIYSRIDHDGGSNQAKENNIIYKPKLVKTIELGKLVGTCGVTKMTFSPDSRYLAIVLGCLPRGTDVIVWDLQTNKIQSHVHCGQQYGVESDYNLIWSHGGKIISFGVKQQWNPMTGEALPDNPASGRMAQLNKDGSKMLTVVGTVVNPSTINIYDTDTWEMQNIYLGGLVAAIAVWTSDNKILAGVSPTTSTNGKELYGMICHWYDVALLLLDPTGKENTKSVWFPAKPTNDPKLPFVYSLSIGPGSSAITNFVTNQIFLDSGKIIDGVTLKVDSYHAKDVDDKSPGAFGMAFGDDGHVLYLKGASFKHGGRSPTKNSAIDVASGKLLAQFTGALDYQGSLATSPDGTCLAMGDGQSVLIFRLQ